MAEVRDNLADVRLAKYLETIEVDEVDQNGQPTGKKIRVPKHPIDVKEMERREGWARGRIEKLKQNPKVKEIIVTRGSYDEVIGVAWVTVE